MKYCSLDESCHCCLYVSKRITKVHLFFDKIAKFKYLNKSTGMLFSHSTKE